MEARVFPLAGRSYKGLEKRVKIFHDSLGTSFTCAPHGCAYNPLTKTLLVCDVTNCCIRAMSVDSHHLTTNPELSFGERGNGAGHFIEPVAVDVNPRGEIAVADVKLTRIQVFTGNGQILYQFGKYGTGRGEFREIVGLRFTPLGQLAILDAGNHRVQVVTTTGGLVLIFGTEGWQPGEFSAPCALAVARNGDLFVCDQGNKRIHRFSAKGKLLACWGSQRMITAQWKDAIKDQVTAPLPTLRSMFVQPCDVMVGPTGEIVVCDAGKAQIFIFTDSGTCIHVLSVPYVHQDRVVPIALAFCQDALMIVTQSKQLTAQDKAQKHSMVVVYPPFKHNRVGKFDWWPMDCFLKTLGFLMYQDALQLRLVNRFFHSVCRQLRNEWRLFPLTPGTPSIVKSNRMVHKATGLVAVKEAFEKWGLRIYKPTQRLRKHAMDFDAGFCNAISLLYGPLFCYQHEPVLADVFGFFASNGLHGKAELDQKGFIEIVTLIEEVRAGLLKWEQTAPFRNPPRHIPPIRQPDPGASPVASLAVIEDAQHHHMNKLLTKLMTL